MSLAAHSEDLCFSAAFSPDGRQIVTAADDGSVRLWNVAAGSVTLTLEGHTKTVREVGFSPDGRRVLTASHDHTARVWDAMTGAELARLKHPDEVYRATFSPNGQMIATGGFEDQGRLWRRRRPEWWWGVVYLPEFWLTVACAAGLVCSILRDWRMFDGRGNA